MTLKNTSDRWRGALPAAAAALLLTQGCHGRQAQEYPVVRQALAAPTSVVRNAPATDRLAGTPQAPAQTDLVVHVAGAVRKPGVYRLPQGARANDGVRIAGGALPAADQDAINLAAPLSDGDQLYVPIRGEEPRGTAATSRLRPAPSQGGTPRRGRPTATGSPAHATKLTSAGGGTINLNTATIEDLQRLPGVGPATAARIMDHRKGIGRFTSPEQLMDISGIGEKRYDRIRPLVRVR